MSSNCKLFLYVIYVFSKILLLNHNSKVQLDRIVQFLWGWLYFGAWFIDEYTENCINKWIRLAPQRNLSQIFLFYSLVFCQLHPYSYNCECNSALNSKQIYCILAGTNDPQGYLYYFKEWSPFSGGRGGDGVFKARNGEMRISENYLEIIHIFLLLVFLPTTL